MWGRNPRKLDMFTRLKAPGICTRNPWRMQILIVYQFGYSQVWDPNGMPLHSTASQSIIRFSLGCCSIYNHPIVRTTRRGFIISKLYQSNYFLFGGLGKRMLEAQSPFYCHVLTINSHPKVRKKISVSALQDPKHNTPKGKKTGHKQLQQ